MDLHFFDRNTEYTVIERRLPHWVQAGVVCFVTWRTDDSIPALVLEKWRQERRQWLRLHAINPISQNWRQQLQLLDILLSCRTTFTCWPHFLLSRLCWSSANHGSTSLLMKSTASSISAADSGNRTDLITSCDQKNSFCIFADTSPGTVSKLHCRRQSLCIIRS